MGLDNYPTPYPCTVSKKFPAKWKKTKLKDENGKVVETPRIDCDKTNCPFKKLSNSKGMFGTYCWIRGKAYDETVENITGISLYDNRNRGDLQEMLDSLNDATCDDRPPEEVIADRLTTDRDEAWHVEAAKDFRDFLDCLLNKCDNWDGELEAWF